MKIEIDREGELCFEGERIPSVKSFDRNGNVFLLGTFSKIFCPGYRIGWIAGDKEAIKKYVLVKSLERKVAFVPGGSFFPNGGHENTMRLNYSNMPEDRIADGLKRLGKTIKEYGHIRPISGSHK